MSKEINKMYVDDVFAFGEDAAKRVFLKALEINDELGLDNEVLVKFNNQARTLLKGIKIDMERVRTDIQEVKSGLQNYFFDIACPYHSSSIFNINTGKVDIVIEKKDKPCYHCDNYENFIKLVDKL